MYPGGKLQTARRFAIYHRSGEYILNTQPPAIACCPLLVDGAHWVFADSGSIFRSGPICEFPMAPRACLRRASSEICARLEYSAARPSPVRLGGSALCAQYVFWRNRPPQLPTRAIHHTFFYATHARWLIGRQILLSRGLDG